MKTNKNHTLYALLIILAIFIIGGWNTCQAQEKQYPHKIVLEKELEQVVKLKILAVEELTKKTQTYTHKNKSDNMECIPKNKINIPKNNAIIREECYYENNK